MDLLIIGVHWVIRVVIIALIIRAVLSWIAPMTMHPAALALNRITDPLLKPVQNMIGVQSGVDFSPLIVIVLLSIIDGLLLGLL